MRRAEAHTCYLRSDGNETYQFRCIGEMDDSKYYDETFYVDTNYIYNEDAGWSGFTAMCQDNDIIITQDDFDQLKTFVEAAKTKIVESLKRVSKVRDRDLQVGDCVFSHYEAETDDICDYDSSSCHKILEISGNVYKVVNILDIDPYHLEFGESIEEYSDDLAEELITNAMLINEIYCVKANEDAKATRNKLVEMIKTLINANK